MSFSLSDGIYDGVCIIQLKGHWTLGTPSRAFMRLFDRRINEGHRFFVVDVSAVTRMDSTTLGNMFSVPVRLSLRVSELAVVYPAAGFCCFDLLPGTFGHKLKLLLAVAPPRSLILLPKATIPPGVARKRPG